MKTEFLTAQQFDKWDSFIRLSPQYSVYLNSWYLNALNKKFEIVVCTDDASEILGGIVLIQNEIKNYSNPLLCKYLGVCYKNFDGNTYTIETNRRDVLKALMPVLEKYKTFDYTFHPTFNDWLVFYWAKYTMRINYTYVIDYAQGLPQIIGNFYSRVRSKIKAAEKEGYTVKKDIDFELFYELVKMTFERQGGPPPYSKPFLKTWYEALKPHSCVEFFGVFHEDKCMAVAGILYDDYSANLLFSGINHNEIKKNANEFLIYKVIEHYSDKAKYFDFEGSMLKQVETFYRTFGGELKPYYKIWYPGLINTVKQFLVPAVKKLLYGK